MMSFQTLVKFKMVAAAILNFVKSHVSEMVWDIKLKFGHSEFSQLFSRAILHSKDENKT